MSLSFSWLRGRWARGLALSVLSAASVPALAQAVAGGSALPLMVAQGAGGNSYSVPIQTLLFFTAPLTFSTRSTSAPHRLMWMIS